MIGQKLGCCHLIGLYINTRLLDWNTLCAQLKNWILPYQDLYVGYHYFLGIYHLLPFGSSELHVFENRFFIQEFCFVHSIIYWFVPSFPSRLHSVSFLYSLWCLHSISSLYSFHYCIHFHAFQHHLYNCFKIYSFQVSFIFTFIHNSELLLKEDNDKYLKLVSYQFWRSCDNDLWNRHDVMWPRLNGLLVYGSYTESIWCMSH